MAVRRAAASRASRSVTTSSDSDLLDLFTFHVPREAWRPDAARPGLRLPRRQPGAPLRCDAPADPGYGFFDDAPARPAPPATRRRRRQEADGGQCPGQGAAAPAPGREGLGRDRSIDATLRVSVEKVDQLINLVGDWSSRRPCWRRTAANVDPALYQQLASAWPTWNATPATCRNR